MPLSTTNAEQARERQAKAMALSVQGRHQEARKTLAPPVSTHLVPATPEAVKLAETFSQAAIRLQQLRKAALLDVLAAMELPAAQARTDEARAAYNAHFLR